MTDDWIRAAMGWDEARHLMEWVDIRGRAAKARDLPSLIGVDDKVIAKSHRSMTLVCELKESTVEYIGEDRKETSLAAYFEVFPEGSGEGIEAISLDICTRRLRVCPAIMHNSLRLGSDNWPK